MAQHETLRDVRERLGLKQADLGSQHIISEIENGKKMPGIGLRRRIAERLSVAAKAARLPSVTLPEVLDLCQACQSKQKSSRRPRRVHA